MFPGAVSQMKGPIFLRFLPLRHSISQHFTVLLIRHAMRRRAAVVEQMGDATAGQLSLQVKHVKIAMFVLFIVHFLSNAGKQKET